MWSKPTLISDQHYLDWIFPVHVYENNNLFNIPIWSYVKIMPCGPSWISDWHKNTHILEGNHHSSNFLFFLFFLNIWQKSWLECSSDGPLQNMCVFVSIRNPRWTTWHNFNIGPYCIYCLKGGLNLSISVISKKKYWLFNISWQDDHCYTFFFYLVIHALFVFKQVLSFLE
jgi:hypothetical protein